MLSEPPYYPGATVEVFSDLQHLRHLLPSPEVFDNPKADLALKCRLETLLLCDMLPFGPVSCR